jgi:hypothetical protein
MKRFQKFYRVIVTAINGFINKWLKKRNNDDDLFDHPYAIL